MIHYIVYISAALELFTDDELKELLLQSETNNKIYGITGLLLYYKGVFMQLIEGGADNIKQLFNNIEHDPRNTAVIKLAENDAEQRAFPGWAMAFKAMSEEEFVKIEAYTHPEKLKLPENEKSEAIRLLKTFVDSHK